MKKVGDYIEEVGGMESSSSPESVKVLLMPKMIPPIGAAVRNNAVMMSAVIFISLAMKTMGRSLLMEI